MKYYVYFLIILIVLELGFYAGRSEEEKAASNIFGLLVLLPIFGRVLGWW